MNENAPQDSTPFLESGGGGTTISSYKSLEQPAQTRSLGLTDGFETWSDSSNAFKQAVFHAGVYVTIGIVAYSFLLDTKWPLIDSVYFSVVIFTTVGYGDLSPASSNAGMIFTLFFAFYGITILGIFLGILGDMYLERQQVFVEAALKQTRAAYLAQIAEDLKKPDGADEDDAPEESEESDQFISLAVLSFVKEQMGNIIILTIILVPIVVLEGWSPVKGLYWMVVTGTTVGLGDEYPTSDWSKAICILYIPLLVVFAGNFLGRMASVYVDKRNGAIEAKFFERAMRESDLEKMDTNKDNRVSKDEFLVYMLTTMQKVEKDDIDEIFELFNKFDKDRSGVLTANDLRVISERTTVYSKRGFVKSPSSLI
eukprot:jgi/Psemu1/177967/e_gw1.3.68.1